MIRKIGIVFFLSALISICQGQNAIDLRIRISGADSDLPEMLKKLRIVNPLHISLTQLNPKIEQMIGFYENAGYPFVRITLDSVSTFENEISGVLAVNPGDYVLIDTLLNRTNFNISLGVLFRLINIRPGDQYREFAINDASKRLSQIPYLTQTRPLEVGFHSGKASVYLYPEKINSNRFDGWVGLSPNSPGKTGLAFSGLLVLSLNNVIGQGESWKFDWHRNQDASQRLNLGAHIPYLVGLPFGFEGKFDLYRQDTSYLNLGWEIGIPYHFNPNHLLNVFIRGRESSILLSETDTRNSLFQPFYSLLSGLSWDINHFDSPINPYRGYQIKIETSTGRKSMPDSASMQQSEFIANFSMFQPLSKNLTAAFMIHSGYRISHANYVNEQYRLGGINQLRGFDEDVFHTDAYAVTSLELRYLIDKTSHLVVLSDFGFLRIRENDIPILKIPVGLGLGGQIRTAGGIFRIIFAVGKQPTQAVNFKNAKIHLGYVGVF